MRTTGWVLALGGCLAFAPAASGQLSLEVTVAESTGDPEEDGGLCGTETTLAVAPGDDVVFCYRVRNTTVAATFTTHDLGDEVHGVLLNDFSYSLGPGATAFLTRTSTITEPTVNEATWVASGPFSASASESATVTIGEPALELDMTVAPSTGDPEVDGGLCGVPTSIQVPPGQAIVICYRAENTGEIPLGRHFLDSELAGSVLSDFSYALAPGANAFVTQTVTPTTTTIETGIWTGRNAVNPEYEAIAVDAVLVTVPEPAAGTLAAGVAATLAGIAARRVPRSPPCERASRAR